TNWEPSNRLNPSRVQNHIKPRESSIRKSIKPLPNPSAEVKIFTGNRSAGELFARASNTDVRSRPRMKLRWFLSGGIMDEPLSQSPPARPLKSKYEIRFSFVRDKIGGT